MSHFSQKYIILLFHMTFALYILNSAFIQALFSFYSYFYTLSVIQPSYWISCVCWNKTFPHASIHILPFKIKIWQLIIWMAAITRAIFPKATQYSKTCCISQSSTVRHHFSTDDFLDWFELPNAQCGKAIKTHQAWICLNIKAYGREDWVKEKGTNRKWQNWCREKERKRVCVCVCVCGCSTRSRVRLTVAYASSYTTTCGQSSES